MSRDQSPIVRPVSPDEGYTWIHRAFLQAFKTRGVMTVEELKPILAYVMTCHNPERPWTAGDITQPHILSTVQTINSRIEPYDFEIRSIRDQHTKASTYAFVNKTSDSLTQLATRFTAAEIGYIRRLLDFMFETSNTHTREIMAIKHTEASQLARPSRRNRQSQLNSNAEDGQTSQATDTGISIQEADDVLDTLLNESFFYKSRSGYYSLAPRALMELGAYLKETYNESPDEAEDGLETIRIRDCEGCKEIVTHGIRCNEKECGVRWHDACATAFYRGRTREARKCPKCETECTGDLYVGERAGRVGMRANTAGDRRTSHSTRDYDEEE
ncbi:Nse1 non-SMC component of SMC5-6 complex-domain-containing protein [Pyrenochaeta sp. MPI-SDFR-AT-0127]|nr:Nse1 non-SMC component of SMC5-6 complex-domain-containing protein [Pyrenochaeta sp. MPI-SDFR-AT-0127]